MKNTINISAAGEDLLSSVDDGTNRLFINGSEVPSASWTGAGTYSATVQGHAITVAQVADTTGNVAIRKTAAYTYALYKIKTGTTIDGDLNVTGDIYEGGQSLAEKYGGSEGKFITLWTGTASSMGATTIPLSESADNFDFLICGAAYWGNGNDTLVLLPKSGSTNIMVPNANTTAEWAKRSVTVNGTSVTVTNGRWVNGGSTDNSASACIPHVIYGVKL